MQTSEREVLREFTTAHLFMFQKEKTRGRRLRHKREREREDNNNLSRKKKTCKTVLHRKTKSKTKLEHIRTREDADRLFHGLPEKRLQVLDIVISQDPMDHRNARVIVVPSLEFGSIDVKIRDDSVQEMQFARLCFKFSFNLGSLVQHLLETLFHERDIILLELNLLQALDQLELLMKFVMILKFGMQKIQDSVGRVIIDGRTDVQMDLLIGRVLRNNILDNHNGRHRIRSEHCHSALICDEQNGSDVCGLELHRRLIGFRNFRRNIG
mmetsp:Transcript_36217/g.41241  ORF Transcript_36217/g.41241 Transcript_36217/m.41241 type:complete len:268 (-) Transcript_36217:1477-2280(-)